MSDTPITEGGDWPSPKYAQEIVFEGFPCFAVSPEEYSALYESHAKLERELAALKAGDPSCPMYGWSIETKAGKDLILVRDEVAAKAMVGIGYIARPVIEQSDAQAAIAQRDATIAELRAKLEWQPIETAPDERSIDIWLVSMDNPEFGVRITCVHRVGSRWFGIPDYYKEDRFKPTHWMPLPNLPALADGERHAGVRRSPIE